MDKKTKIILGGLFIAASIGLYIWDKNKDKDGEATSVAPSAPATIICNEGEEPCPNNPLICYTKGLRYEGFSPCDIVKGQEIGTPIAEPTNGGDENIGTHINTR
jgi:hypothetical protein